MPTRVYASLAFTICAMVFMVFVLIMYTSKKRYRKIENNIFLFMLILTSILLISEVVYVLAIDHYFPTLQNVFEYGKENFRYFFDINKLDGSNSISTYFNNTLVIPKGILNIICRNYLILSALWVVSLIAYVWTLAAKYKNKVLSKKNIILIFATSFLLFATSIFISFQADLVIEKQVLTGMYVFGGDAVTSLYAIAFIVSVFISVGLLKSGKSIPSDQKIPIYFSFLIFIITTILQLIFNFDINDLTYIFAFIMTTLYFTIESQDYQLIDELKTKKEEAEIADKQKTAFLSNMSHEIRTPLNTILGFSESLLSEKKLTKEMVIRDVKSIYDASDVLLELINNILDISRIESGKEELEIKEYELKNLVFEINSFVSSKINKESLSFNIQVDNNLPKKYNGDYVKIYKVLISIILNAIKYTGYGNINLNITGSDLKDNRYNLNFTISNTGHAMKLETFDVDFSDFVSLKGEKQPTIDSTMLGIIVSKRLIAMMNGKIEFVNKPGEGTKYIINLPMEVTNYEKIGSIFDTTFEEEKESTLDLTGKKVLIVDDNDINIKLATRLLSSYNFVIDSVTSGKDAIDKVKNEKYDIIFLDHMMPEMDGVETLSRLKSSGYFVPPVIALTANNYTGLKDKYVSLGFTDYLSKPINIKELNKIINNVFNTK